MKRRAFPGLTLIWSGISAFLVLLAVLMAGQQYRQYHRTLEDTEDRLMTQARIINENLGSNLTFINVLLTDIIGMLNRTPGPGAALVNVYLKHQDDLIPGIRTIFITDARGRIIHSSNQKIIGFDGSGRDYFQTALAIPDPAGLVISPPFQTVLGTSVVTVAKSVKGKNGEFRGVVAATLDKDYFSILLGSVRYAADNRVTLVHSAGDVFISIPSDAGFIGKNLRNPGSLFARHMDGGASASIQRGLSSMLGERRIAALITCIPPDVRVEHPLVISVSRSMDAVLAPWRRDTAVLIVLYLVVAGLTVAITVILLRYRSEHKKAEEEHQRLMHLESLEVLAGGMAHDFNNILTSMIGFIGIAKENAQPGDSVDTSLAAAIRSGLHAKELNQRLLTFANGGRHPRVTMPVDDIIRESLEILKGSGVSAELTLPEDLRPIPIDAEQLRQVFVNLVTNARDSMPDGGTLAIQGENLRLSSGQTPPLAGGDYIRITVRDTGKGIAPEHLPRITDPYFTTKDTYSRKGLGLGLAVCSSVIRRHNGLMTVVSRPGAGTTIVILLPAFA